MLPIQWKYTINKIKFQQDRQTKYIKSRQNKKCFANKNILRIN